MKNKYVISPLLDFLLIQFPIWVPLLYFASTNLFPNFYWIILISYLIVGEIHFGSTYIFFFDKKYRELFVTEKYIFIFWPILIIFFCVFFAIYFSVSAVLFIILLFNFWHVNRQSIGILNLYNNKEFQSINKLSINLLYIISFLLCAFGVIKFILKLDFYFENESQIISLFSIVYILSVFYLFLKLKKSKSDDFNLLFNFSTGVFIFAPVLFCSKIIDVFAMGVGMHYIQYITITWAVFKRKSDKKKTEGDLNYSNLANLNKIIIYLIIYAVLMVFFSNTDIEYKNEQIGIYLVPIFFQLMHFYIDMFVWRFSKSHTRENLNPYLYRLS